LRKPSESLNVLAISVDSPEQSREFAEKIAADGKGKVDYRILSDPGHQVIDGYGIRDPDYNGQKFEGIPRPTVYVINKDGRVTWMKVELNYKERPTNSDIRAALDAVGTDQISIIHRKLLINTTSLITTPRLSINCLPSAAQSNEKMRLDLKFVSRFAGPAEMG
jgi:hypothetical protein